MSASGHSPRLRGFDPIWREDARILILGSMPSVRSLADRGYYAHPRNAFWPVMEALFGIDAAATYPERTAALVEARVALWDVVGSARRRGSLDTAIQDVEANDIPKLLGRMPSCGLVATNGGKASELFRKHARPRIAQIERAIAHVRLPSTSPAHAAMSLAEKIRVWRTGLETHIT